VLAQYNAVRVEDLPVNFDGIALQAGEEYGNEVFDKHYSSLWQCYEQQNRVHGIAALTAPFLAVRSVSMGLAGTDWAQHRHFAVAAETYRRALVRMMNDDLTYNSRPGQYNHVGDRRLWEQMPPFEYHAPGLAWVMAEQAWSLTLLFLWFVAASTAAIVAVTKMKVELR
jgi:ABC-2 type transport system permease protein